MLKKNNRSNIFSYAAIIFLTSILLVFFYYSPNFHFYFPLAYSEDALSTSALVKTIVETGWYLSNPNLGAPGIYHLVDYPNSDLASMFFLKIIALFSKNYVVVLNSFYFLTFILVACISLAVFEWLGLNKIFSFVASLLFTFLPYHFMRGENHLFLTTYYVVPIYIFLAFLVYQTSIAWTPLRILSYAGIGIFAASSGVYYAFFGSFFVLLAGVMASVEYRHFKPLLRAIGIIFFIGTICMANMAPSIFSKIKNGPNTQIAYRAPAESEMAGLKIIQMVSPVDHHRLRGFKKSKDHYNKSAPLVNENRMASLGIVGAIGFFILLGLLLLRKDISSLPLFLLSRFNIFAVLLGTIGGFGAIIAYHVSPMIRSYNRISVFIAFFSLSAIFLLLQKITKRHLCIALIILVIGILDEVPGQLGFPAYSAMQKDFLMDAAFVSQIENRLPKGSRVFQLPYMYFPESPAIYGMKEYDPFRPFLHSSSLHWSYGAEVGREVAAWQEKISALPPKIMLQKLISAGFSGIYLDRNGFADHGRKIEKALRNLIAIAPLESSDGRFVFYQI